MIVKKHSYFSLFIFLTLLFVFVVLFLHPSTAAALEVSYPTISLGNQSASLDFNNATLPNYVRYLFFAGIAIGFFAVFLSLLIAGVQYIISPVEPSERARAKDRFFGAMTGLLILALTYLILSTINPQLNILNLNKLPPTPAPPAQKPTLGVSFYNTKDCAQADGDFTTAEISDQTDLGGLKNKVNSVGIVDDPDNNVYYIPIIYDTVDLQGKCQYLDPNKTCQNVDTFANSASVLQWDPHPNGDGVYFYRKPCYNSFNGISSTIAYCNQHEGGYYEVNNAQIQAGTDGGLFVLDLNDNQTRFTNVPPEDQTCTQYNKDGICTNTQSPTLGGENISSMIINGNYKVLLVYSTSANGPWTSCQIFPTIDDTNQIGPEQLNWERIRNANAGVVPNYAIIIPVKKQ